MSVYIGESFTFTVEGHEFRADIREDDSHGAPWENDCGMLEVQRVSHGHTKRASECFLYRGSRREYSYVYHVGESQAKARTESWGCNEKTQAAFVAEHGREPGPREMAVLAVRDNAEYLAEWCRDDWSFVGVEVSMLDAEGEAIPGRKGSLWGVESLSDYARDEVAPELAREILAELAWDQAREETKGT